MKFNSHSRQLNPSYLRLPFYGTICLLLILVSCKAPKYEQHMFKTPYDETYEKMKKDKPPIVRFPGGSGESDSLYQYRIRVDDVINVRFLNQATNQLPDPILGITAQTNPTANVNPSTETTDPSNYTVDVEGNILLPLIGAVRAVGSTTLELRKTIQKLYEQYYVAPEIDIRIINLRVTVIGEVRTQGVITLPRERTTLQEVLAITQIEQPSARLDNVKIIRGKKVIWVDMTNIKALDYRDLILHPDDIVYVSPRPLTRIQRNLQPFTTIISVVSVFTSFAILLRTFVR